MIWKTCSASLVGRCASFSSTVRERPNPDVLFVFDQTSQCDYKALFLLFFVHWRSFRGFLVTLRSKVHTVCITRTCVTYGNRALLLKGDLHFFVIYLKVRKLFPRFSVASIFSSIGVPIIMLSGMSSITRKSNSAVRSANRTDTAIINPLVMAVLPSVTRIFLAVFLSKWQFSDQFCWHQVWDRSRIEQSLWVHSQNFHRHNF